MRSYKAIQVLLVAYITKTLKTPSNLYASVKPMPSCLYENLVSLWASSLSFNQTVTLCEGFKLEGKKQEKANQLTINN